MPFYLEPYISAFLLLSSDRINTNNGWGSIPFTSIIAYTNWANIDDSQTFVEVMREIDDEFVKQSNNKLEKKMERETKRYGNVSSIRS